MTFNSDTPAMYGPDVLEPDPMAEIYHSLRRRANELGFVTVGEALDALAVLGKWAGPAKLEKPDPCRSVITEVSVTRKQGGDFPEGRIEARWLGDDPQEISTMVSRIRQRT